MATASLFPPKTKGQDMQHKNVVVTIGYYTLSAVLIGFNMINAMDAQTLKKRTKLRSNWSYSIHALQRMSERCISKKEIEKTLTTTDGVVSDKDSKKRIYQDVSGPNPLKVILAVDKRKIITAFRLSSFPSVPITCSKILQRDRKLEAKWHYTKRALESMRKCEVTKADVEHVLVNSNRVNTRKKIIPYQGIARERAVEVAIKKKPYKNGKIVITEVTNPQAEFEAGLILKPKKKKKSKDVSQIRERSKKHKKSRPINRQKKRRNLITKSYRYQMLN